MKLGRIAIRCTLSSLQFLVGERALPAQETLASSPKSSRPPSPEPRQAKPGPVIVVETEYSGADAGRIADALAAPVEQQINGVENLLHVYSRSTSDGKYTLLAAFGAGVDAEVAQAMVQNRVNLTLPVLPDSIRRRGVSVKKQAAAVQLFVAIFSPDGRYDDLYLDRYAAIQIKNVLERVEGVGEVSLFGGAGEGFNVYVDPEKLDARSLTIRDVNRTLGEGQSKGFAREVGALSIAERLGDLIVKSASNGQVVHLRDVARVEFGADRTRGVAKLDGKPAAVLGIRPKAFGAANGWSKAVAAAMTDLKNAFPEGIDYSADFSLAPSTNFFGSSTRPRYLLTEPLLPEGASLERYQEVLHRYDGVLRRTEGIEHVLTLPENPFARFGDGFCQLALLASNRRPAAADQVARATLRGRLAEEKGAMLRLRELSGDGRYPLDFAIQGPDPDALRRMADELLAGLAATGNLLNLSTGSNSAHVARFFAEIDQVKAIALSVSIKEVSEALQACTGSIAATEVVEFGLARKVRVRFHAGDPTAALQKIKVRNSKGVQARLGDLVSVREQAGPNVVDRFDFLPMFEITAEPSPPMTLAEARWLCETHAEKARAKLGLSPEYALVWLRDIPPPKVASGAGKTAPADLPRSR